MPETEGTPTEVESSLLVNEVFRSILQPEHFVEVLELWDRTVFQDAEANAAVLDALEQQVTNAIPLLEASLKSVVNEDELLNRLARLERPGMLISQNGLVVGVNEGGRSYFGLEAGDRIDFDRLEPAAMRKLKKVIAHAQGKTKGKAQGKDGEDAFDIINLDGVSRGVLPADNLVGCRSIRVETGTIGYVLINAMNLVLSETGANAFRQAFGATDAEMRILGELIAGRRQTEIAAINDIREDTVKKHIQSLREKASVPNTTALVCLAAGFAQITADQGRVSLSAHEAARSVTNSSGQTYTRPARHKAIRIDGILVEYIDQGDRHGLPLLIHHSSMVGFVLPPEFIDELCRAGYRVILPFRPRCGTSEALPGAFSISAIARHFLKLLDALGVDKFACLAGTVGFVYASRMATLAPERITGIVGIAAYLPVDRIHLHRSMAKYQRAVMYTQLRNRHLAKFLVLSGYKMYLQFGAYRFLSQMMRYSAADLKVLDDSNALGVLTVGLRIGGAQGVDALLDDTSLILADWSGIIRDLQCPVRLLHGTDDSVFKPEVMQAYCEGHSDFELTVLPGMGQLMIYSDPQGIASLVIKRLQSMHG